MKERTSFVLLASGGLLSFALLAAGSSGAAPIFQEEGATLQERLGYGREARLMIVHADDVGVAHSVNAATFQALDRGLVSSASIMVPCSWLPEVAEYARAHPEADFGLHLTLTSEWDFYKWGPVSPVDQVFTLVNAEGFLYPNVQQAVSHMDPAHAEQEIRAQVRRAMAVGIRPTHLDSHMATLFRTRELFEVYLKVGREFGLPVLMSRGFRPSNQDFFGVDLGDHRNVVIDRIVSANPRVSPDGWDDFYDGIISNLLPGVTELIIHLGFDDAELRAMTARHPYGWDAPWRQRDFDYFTSERFAWLLRQHGVRLVTWREIGALLK